VNARPFAFAALALAWIQTAFAEDQPREPFRQALLVGEWSYDSHVAHPLGGMEKDLEALTQAFDSVHFDRIEPLANPTQQEFQNALDKAAARAAEEGKHRATLTVVYFAGHGAMVGNESYLLTVDYVPPVESGEILLQGGVGTSYLGRAFAKLGQPSILIVEACRNAYVPDANARRLEHQELPDDDSEGVMIGAPSLVGGYGTFYAQEPGQPVQLAQRDPGKPSALSAAIRDNISHYSSASLLFTVVGTQIAANSPYPLAPEYLDKLSGDLRFFFDEKAARDDLDEWQSAKARGRGYVETFAYVFRTSRYLGAAREWLAEQKPSAETESYIVYSRNMQKYLGAKPRSIFSKALTELRSAADTVALVPSDRAGTFDRIKALDVAQVEQGDNGTFEIRLHDNRIVETPVAPMAADPSRVPAYWSKDVEGIDCPADSILRGNCPAVEQLASMAQLPSEERGTIFVAAVFNRAGAPETIDATFSRIKAIGERLDGLGVPRGRVQVRSYFEADLGVASRSPVLVKRGTGQSLGLE
jgi:hypothetical protein